MSKTIEERAVEFVETLFTNGAGLRADRLVLTTDDGRNLGGWSRGPIAYRVADFTREVAAEKDAEIRRITAALDHAEITLIGLRYVYDGRGRFAIDKAIARIEEILRGEK